jgi:thiamine biosynthesis lipoprotein
MVSILVISGCTTEPDEYLFQGGTMGTSWSVKILTDTALDQTGTNAAIQQVLDLVNSKMSNWDAASEVSQFNAASAGCYPISPETATVVKVSQELSKLSEGVFDATVGPLIELWGFGTNYTSDQMPEPLEIEALIPEIGYQKLHLNNLDLCKENDKLFVNLSATAKGYGVDLVAEYLESAKLDRYLVEVGGEVRVSGLNAEDQKWRIGIETPLDGLQLPSADAIQDLVEMDRGALATSGDYRNYFLHEDRRYSHVIDPRTGYPILQELASVTVIHDSTLWADGWATTLLALGPEKGLQLAEQQNLAAYLVLRTDTGFEVLTSSSW